MLWGSFSAKIDEKSRLRMPAKFRRDDQDTYFVTSYDGKHAKVFPIEVWERIARELQQYAGMDPVQQKLQRITGYFGLVSQMDPQGRIMIPQTLREAAKISGDVVVIGATDHVEVWNEEIFRNQFVHDPLTTEELGGLAERINQQKQAAVSEPRMENK
ncbi:MAG: division/cell wall cluster transcriptional repressor MraZ [Acidobacteria bacterium]|nr:division/cell wall cluster transcriptional repressor MraZ [Acidobacteriota bacterium]